MIAPVRCFTCGKVVGSKWNTYKSLVDEGKSMKEALDEIKLVKFCCRSAIMSHVEIIDTVGKYK